MAALGRAPRECAAQHRTSVRCHAQRDEGLPRPGAGREHSADLFEIALAGTKKAGAERAPADFLKQMAP
ncbi:hypothetical protein RA19_14095 [Leisingera sp. ANG-M1]|nr:hypothetical protein RA19_14095 [Leisingera sp. ANG-M1]